MIYQLTYSSKADNYDSEILTDIFKKSVYNNFRNDIKAFLFVVNCKSFVQVLQGTSQKLNDLYHRISKDNRHYDVRLIDYSRIEKRTLEFANIRVCLNEDVNEKIFRNWNFLLDSNGYIMSELLDLNFIMSCIQRGSFSFETCCGESHYNFQLISDMFHIANDDNYLQLMDALNQYNTLYDFVYRQHKNGRSREFLQKTEERLKSLVYQKN